VSDLLAVHRRVVESSAMIVGQVTLDDLDAATPCAGWMLGDLIAHMIGQHYGFAAAADGAGQDRAAFAPRPVRVDPAGEYAAAARSVLAAFTRPGLLDDSIFLPEIRGGMTLPATTAIEFHLVDYVAHGWDVARAIGVPAPFDPEALQTALVVALAVPDEAKTLDQDTPFHPAAPSMSMTPLDRIVATLGRAPDWRPPR
jgi:uncharacterized protein (TIGR03086 family)